jgi:hypothetical protein
MAGNSAARLKNKAGKTAFKKNILLLRREFLKNSQ